MTIDPTNIAFNAAGIADAFRYTRSTERDGDTRYHSIADMEGGFIGIAAGLARAGETMERVRDRVGDDAHWGDCLPHVYIAWGAIAAALWAYWGDEDVESITERALLRLFVARSVDEFAHMEEE